MALPVKGIHYRQGLGSGHLLSLKLPGFVLGGVFYCGGVDVRTIQFADSQCGVESDEDGEGDQPRELRGAERDQFHERLPFSQRLSQV